MITTQLTRRQMCQVLAVGPAAAGVLKAIGASADDDKPKPKVLMPIGDATEAMDTLYPFFRIPEDGFDLVVAGPEARLYHAVLHEVPPNTDPPWDITQERPGYHIQADIAFGNVDPVEYVGVFVSGGRAPEYLRYDKDLMRIMQHFHTANKPIGCLCHGIEILAAAECIRGRTVTTVPKCAMDCAQGGAKYVDRPVVVDGNVVTARGWQDHTPLLRIFMQMLKDAVETV